MSYYCDTELILCVQKTDVEIELAAQKKGAGRPFWNDAEHFEMLVGLLRQKRGIRNMLRILNPKTTEEDDSVPQADLPGLRALACKVLAGIARSPPCQQIFQQLSYIRGGELQGMDRLHSTQSKL